MKPNRGLITIRRHRRSLAGAAGILAALLFLLLFSSPAWASHTIASATLHDANGNTVGRLTLVQRSGVVEVRAEVKNLPPGFHGFHIHEAGVCAAPFTTAGGHLNPASQSHPAHAADMPVLLVNANGTGEARFPTDRFAVSDLFDADGSAVIVHASPDNYANIPTRYVAAPDAATLATGDAGGRIACGVIERSR